MLSNTIGIRSVPMAPGEFHSETMPMWYFGKKRDHGAITFHFTRVEDHRLAGVGEYAPAQRRSWRTSGGRGAMVRHAFRSA